MSSLTLTIIQTSLHWENKTANLQQLEEDQPYTGTDRDRYSAEMFSTGFSMKPELLAETMEGDTVAWMKRVAASRRIILTGSIIIEENGEYYNRLIWMLPNGQFGHYDKRHLFAYADEHEHYAPGHKRLIASVKGWKINLLICYDLRFPVWSRQQVTATTLSDMAGANAGNGDAEYDLLIYVANWPERRNHAWKTLLQARAIENQCFVAGVNRVGNDGNNIYHSGDSMIIDPMGKVLYTKAHDEDTFTITLQKETLDEIRHKLPFLRDADGFIIQS